MNETLLFIILLCVILVNRHHDHSPLTCRQYSCDPILTTSTLFRNPGTCRAVLLFEPVIFLRYVVADLLPSVQLPRSYVLTSDGDVETYISTLRRCQISDIDRCLRFVVCTRNVPFSIMSLLFDQHITTIYRDWDHFCLLCTRNVASKQIVPVIQYSQEYYSLISQNAFRHFDRALYSVDIVKCKYVMPSNVNHTLYYDGHKKQYNYGFLVAVDSTGICRYFYGHMAGSISDQETYLSSDFHTHPERYFGAGDRILADGIFSRIDDQRFIVPVSYLTRPLTENERRYNVLQQWDRAINENYFSRFKGYCPIVMNFKFNINKINQIFISCLALTNIRIKYQSPLRS